MRIGIDARFLSHPQRGGFKTYTENLISTLDVVDDINHYLIYLDRSSADLNVSQKKTWQYKVVEGSFPVLGMVLREQFLLRKRIIDDKVDVIHFLCNTAPINLNERYIITLHDIIQLTTINQFRLLRGLPAHKQWAVMAYSQWAINNSIRAADRVITVSEYEKKEISNHFNIPLERITAIHLAPDPRFKLATESEKNIWRSDLFEKSGIRKRFILGIGYEPRKNIEFLIEIFSKLAAEQSDLDLVVVCAEESRRLHFRTLAEQFRLADKVHILGSLSPESLVILYNLTEVFVYPSERESFGLPPLEAISCGAPTVAMNKTSLPEILGKGALFVDEKDVYAWTNSIKRILTDKNLRLQLVDGGLKQAATFSWQKCAEETVQVYKNVIKEKVNKK